MIATLITPHLSRSGGGIFVAERRLHQSLAAIQEVGVRVIGTRDKFTAMDEGAWSPLVPIIVDVSRPTSFGYSPKLVQAITGTNPDIAYCAGLWTYHAWAVLRWSRRYQKPFIVAPHGMLDTWALRRSRITKSFVSWLFQKNQLRRAACIRVLCQSELESIRAYGLKNPTCVIPNGIDLPASPEDNVSVASLSPERPGLRKTKILLYLGRIHPKKGLFSMIKAWASIQGAVTRKGSFANWVFAIAGWDQNGHESELKRLASELGVECIDLSDPLPDSSSRGPSKAQLEINRFCNSNSMPSIFFLGPQHGAHKADLYAACDAFILPSLSEGLPMVVLEAWSHSKPVLMTPQCNLPEGTAAGAALEVEASVGGVAEGLRRLLEMSNSERVAMGENGRRLVAEKFTWTKVAQEMFAVYKWIQGGGPRPNCVQE